jgi:hypothetical protein
VDIYALALQLSHLFALLVRQIERLSIVGDTAKLHLAVRLEDVKKSVARQAVLRPRHHRGIDDLIPWSKF